jgi:hypothetical protein
VNVKTKNIDNAKWLSKHLIINLEILAALDKTDPFYEVYKEAALKAKHSLDLYLQTVLSVDCPTKGSCSASEPSRQRPPDSA